MRKTKFVNGEYYHIYNRGTDKRDVFSCDKDFDRFIKSLKEFNSDAPAGGLYNKYLQEQKRLGNETSNVPNALLMSNPLVEIIAYCLNPNHYHLILKQLEDRGIEKFMQKVGNGYTKYFNYQNKRSGVLFQGIFQAIHIDSNDYLLYLSAYVNKNHFIHGYSKIDWKYCSLGAYAGKKDPLVCNTDIILGQFNNSPGQYKEFLEANAVHLKSKKEMVRYLLEDES